MTAPRPVKLDARQVALTHYNERTKQQLEVLRGNFLDNQLTDIVAAGNVLSPLTSHSVLNSAQTGA